MPSSLTGVHLIAAERARQVKDEGWDRHHDGEHAHGEMALAAACYAIVDAEAVKFKGFLDDLWGMLWPTTEWSIKWWKPKDPLRNLIRAGALIAAEIDRRLDAGEKLEPRRGDIEDLILDLVGKREKDYFCTSPTPEDLKNEDGASCGTLPTACGKCDACEAFDALTDLVVD